VTRPVAPAGAGSGTAAAWVVPAVGAALLLGSGATWVAGTVASWQQGTGTVTDSGAVTGSGRAPFTLLLVAQVAREGTSSLWPGTSPR
jgi:hypothetical protein